MPPPHSYRFGLFELDARTGELRRDGRLVRRLQEQPLRILVGLLERPGELLTREELRARVWPSDTHVDFDHGLHAVISRLREVLNDSADDARFIQTVSRRGYRFVAPVTRVSDDRAGAAPPPSVASPVADARPTGDAVPGALARPGRRSGYGWLAVSAAIVLVAVVIWAATATGRRPVPAGVRVAVLPLDNLTGDPEQDVFVDGLHEELIFRLGLMQPRRLAVVARTSVMGYRRAPKTVAEVARELSVDYVLEGSVRREGARFRITAQLIRGDDQSHIWTQTYDRVWSDLLSLEADIAARVADALAVELLPAFQARVARDRRITEGAYEAYLRGRYFWNQRTRDRANLARAEAELLRALAAQPDYADAYVALADTYDSMIFSGGAPATKTLEQARTAVARALELDPHLGAAHGTAAYIAMHFDRDWDTAERAFQRSLELSPNDATTRLRLAQLLTVRRRFVEAEREVSAARALDPLAAAVVEYEGWLALYQRADTRALQLMLRASELDGNVLRPRTFNADVFATMGDCEMARSALERVGQAADAFPLVSEASYAAGRCGDRQLVDVVARELAANRATFALAALYLGLGDRNRFFDLLHQADAERSPQVLWVGVDPAFSGARDDPRLGAFLAGLGLE